MKISRFHCPECGLLMTVPRKRPREKGHIKDLYCVNCQKIMKMVENEIITLEEKEKWINGSRPSSDLKKKMK